MDNREELLNKSGENIANLIKLLILHEENITNLNLKIRHWQI